MLSEREWFQRELERRGVSRRSFMAFFGTMAAAIGHRQKEPTLVWLEFQD